MEWISINDQLPTKEWLIEQDILICLEDGSIGMGSFFYEGNYVIYGMKFNGTTKHMSMWYSQPIWWAVVELPPQD